MSIKLEQESPDLLVARVAGQMTRTDLVAFQTEAAPVLQASGNVRFLAVLEDFEGWSTEPGWEDSSFIDENDPYISRFAIVGDENWRDKALMFALAGLRSVDIRYFLSEAEARAWLAA